MRTLVVDDHPVTRKLLAAALAPLGHEVDEAADGEEALSLLSEGGHRLVISDVDMPRTDGFALCRAIRARDEAAYTYVILVTAHAAVEDRVAGLEAGADDFLGKPVEPAELQARVHAARRVLATESRSMVIYLLARLVESRDGETGRHVERVQHYARRIARELGRRGGGGGRIDGDFVRLLFETAPLHDIGKVAVPDAILLKAGRLGPEERRLMEHHTVAGGDTLEAAMDEFPDARFLRMARDIARHHHERWDGGGYPDGLAGESIPLAARIVAVADVFDALVTERVYKAAMPVEQACRIISEGAGGHFDPAVVEAFEACLDDLLLLRARYGDDPAAAARVA